MFAGTYTALITPFRDGQVDYDGFRQLIEAQIAGGVDGIGNLFRVRFKQTTGIWIGDHYRSYVRT